MEQYIQTAPESNHWFDHSSSHITATHQNAVIPSSLKIVLVALNTPEYFDNGPT